METKVSLLTLENMGRVKGGITFAYTLNLKSEFYLIMNVVNQLKNVQREKKYTSIVIQT